MAIEVGGSDFDVDKLWHGPAGVKYAIVKFGVTDREILDSLFVASVRKINIMEFYFTRILFFYLCDDSFNVSTHCNFPHYFLIFYYSPNNIFFT